MTGSSTNINSLTSLKYPNVENNGTTKNDLPANEGSTNVESRRELSSDSTTTASCMTMKMRDPTSYDEDPANVSSSLLQLSNIANSYNAPDMQNNGADESYSSSFDNLLQGAAFTGLVDWSVFVLDCLKTLRWDRRSSGKWEVTNPNDIIYEIEQRYSITIMLSLYTKRY